MLLNPPMGALKGVGARAWHICSAQPPGTGQLPDKGMRPLEAPRYLFLPQGIKGQTKEHS